MRRWTFLAAVGVGSVAGCISVSGQEPASTTGKATSQSSTDVTTRSEPTETAFRSTHPPLQNTPPTPFPESDFGFDVTDRADFGGWITDDARRCAVSFHEPRDKVTFQSTDGGSFEVPNGNKIIYSEEEVHNLGDDDRAILLHPAVFYNENGFYGSTWSFEHPSFDSDLYPVDIEQWEDYPQFANATDPIGRDEQVRVVRIAIAPREVDPASLSVGLHASDTIFTVFE